MKRFSVKGHVFGRPTEHQIHALNVEHAARRFLQDLNPASGLTVLQVVDNTKPNQVATVTINWSMRK